MTVNKNRSVERGAVNSFRALMERHDFIVQEIDGGNDHGEDVYVSFTENGERTGDTIAVQIKGGASYRTASGFRVAIKDHLDYWSNSNTPVFCVVQDPNSMELFWANASAQIRRARKSKTPIKSIKINLANRLDDDTIDTFALKARLYISETGDFHRFLTRLSGVTFDATDYLAYFENTYGEQMIFRQERGKPTASLLHSDLDWDHYHVTQDDIAFTKPAAAFRRAAHELVSSGSENPHPTLRNVILNKPERMWVEACFEASQWVRESGRERQQQDFVSPQRVAPILYSPSKELSVAKHAWRRDPRVNDLMERFIRLGYTYWDIFDTANGLSRTSSREREAAAWSELKSVVHQLRTLKVPGYYLMGNRGRLTRSELRQLLEQAR